MVFLKEFFEKVDFEKKSADDKKHAKLPNRQRVNHFALDVRTDKVQYEIKTAATTPWSIGTCNSESKWVKYFDLVFLALLF